MPPIRRNPLEDPAAGGGPQGVAYDQSQVQDPAAGGMGPPGAGAQPEQPVPDAPIGMLAGSTAGMTNQDLAGATPQAGGLDEGISAPEDDMAAQLQEALNDPNTPPEQRAAIEQQIALAARRAMLGGTQ